MPILAAIAAISLALQSARADLIHVAGGCGWDGSQYCAMAQGNASVLAPFSRRVLVPWLVHLLPTSRTVTGFRIINLVALVGTVAALIWLCRRLGLTGLLPATALVALFVVNPWTVRFFLSYPVQTDNASLALLLAWCAMTLVDRRWAALLGLPVLLALVLTREQWGIVGVVAAWLAVLLGHRRPWWGLSATGVAAGAFAFAVTRPDSGPAKSVWRLVGAWWDDVTTSPTHAARFAFMVVCGLGFVGFLVLLGLREVVADRRLLWLTAVALVTFGVTVLGGQDVDRILMPVGVLVTVVATVLVFRDPGLAPSWIFLVVATVLLWQPFHIVTGDPTSWLQFYGFRIQPLDVVAHRLRSDAATVGLPLLAALGYGAQAALPGPRSRRSRPTA